MNQKRNITASVSLHLRRFDLSQCVVGIGQLFEGPTARICQLQDCFPGTLVEELDSKVAGRAPYTYCVHIIH
jgi:hypothetical protein